MNTINIYFQDEARRIGCGWRTCEVKLGRKWAVLRECATDRRVKLPVAIFHKLRKTEVHVRRRLLKPHVSRSVPASSPGP